MDDEEDEMPVAELLWVPEVGVVSLLSEIVEKVDDIVVDDDVLPTVVLVDSLVV